MNLSVKTEVESSRATVVVSGEVDVSNADSLRSAIDEALEAERRPGGGRRHGARRPTSTRRASACWSAAAHQAPTTRAVAFARGRCAGQRRRASSACSGVDEVIDVRALPPRAAERFGATAPGPYLRGVRFFWGFTRPCSCPLYCVSLRAMRACNVRTSKERVPQCLESVVPSSSSSWSLASSSSGPTSCPRMGRTIGRALRQFRQAQDQMNKMVKTEIYDPLNAAAQRACQRSRGPKKKVSGQSAAAKPETFAEKKARLAAEAEAAAQAQGRRHLASTRPLLRSPQSRPARLGDVRAAARRASRPRRPQPTAKKAAGTAALRPPSPRPRARRRAPRARRSSTASTKTASPRRRAGRLPRRPPGRRTRPTPNGVPGCSSCLSDQHACHLMDHLGELRRRLTIIIVSLFATAIVLYFATPVRSSTSCLPPVQEYLPTDRRAWAASRLRRACS